MLFAGIKKRKPVLLMVLALSLIGGITSCGGGGSSATATQTPNAVSPATPSASTLIVNATSGGEIRSVALKLTIH
jgi:hypothetical protein